MVCVTMGAATRQREAMMVATAVHQRARAIPVVTGAGRAKTLMHVKVPGSAILLPSQILGVMTTHGGMTDLGVRETLAVLMAG